MTSRMVVVAAKTIPDPDVPGNLIAVVTVNDGEVWWRMRSFHNRAVAEDVANELAEFTAKALELANPLPAPTSDTIN